MTDLPMTDSRPKRDRWIPWAFVGFFLVVFAANGIMLTFALRSFNGLSVDGAYDRGLSYNETLAEVQAQFALGWQIDLTVAETASGQWTASLTALDEEGLPVAVDEISAIGRRPISEGLDFDLDFRHAGRGLYEADVQWPQSGNWELRLVIMAGDKSYRLDRRLFIR